MTEQDKNLLYKDLCARLPYNTCVYIEFENANVVDNTVLTAQHIHLLLSRWQ